LSDGRRIKWKRRRGLAGGVRRGGAPCGPCPAEGTEARCMPGPECRKWQSGKWVAAHARPKALNGGHGERLWRRKQPPQAPSAQGKLVIKSLLGANFCTRAGEHGTAAIVPAAFRRRQALSTAWSRPAVAQPCGPGRSGTPAARSPSGWWISPSGIGWSPECRQRMGCQLAGRALAEPWARRRRQQRLQRRRWQRRRQQRRRRRRRRLHLARC